MMMQFEVDMRAPEVERIIGTDHSLEVIADNVTFSEGPVWDPRTRQFYYTDICGDTIWRWKPGVGSEVVLQRSAHANGMCFDREGRLLVAGWGGRTVFRFEKDWSVVTLASHYQGKKLNSPNDIVVRSDGQIYFTDSPGGMLNVGMVGDDLQKYLDIQGVFRITAQGKLILVTDDFVYPNGLCFSPDEKLLYVNCSRERLIRVYDVNADGSVGKGRLFYQYTNTDRGNPDGIKCDVEGNVYCTGPGGIWLHDKQGNVLARLKVPGHPTNFGFGDDDWRSIFVTTVGNVVRTRVNVPGVPGW